MTYVVEMNRGSFDTNNLEMFDCGRDAWYGLQGIAKSYGWVPLGTVVDAHTAKHNPNYMRDFKSDYEPQGWGRERRVSDEDAKGLCAALQLALAAIQAGTFTEWQPKRGVLIREDDDLNAFNQVNASATNLIEPFLAYAQRGGFSFGWDD